ncbi:MAG TPA: preprotein translocase subunit SecA [Candidatus Atribacteria bacterium]|nr:preprotein translocase subunit SecA [Candidatus Atribacteria bacterium]HCU22035.1 preprotein translocase subunit SecA [Candidatus Atribacteria bacterium]
MFGLIKEYFGKISQNRFLKEVTERFIDPVNSLEKEISRLSDKELADKTPYFKNRLENGENLDDILIEAFAVVREAARRVTGMRPFDVQIIGGVVLHEGKIAEMQTGEGKTLVATMPAYLNALTGKGVHIVTVNDYLARRDRYWMGPIFEFLGLTVGLIQHASTFEERKKAYHSDITYGTNTEYGFDYLRDNMAHRREDIVQGELNYAIIDEVDSILIDEARTPLIISGPAEDSTEIYYKIDRVSRKLSHSVDFDFEEKTRSIWLTEEGISKVEKLLHVDNLYDTAGKDSIEQRVRQSLRAHHLYKKDVDYVVRNGEVVIVDEFTGRLMEGRRYSDGLHQAIEAKENVQVANENQTLASVTYQNYFRMYDKICGMTGTAKTEEDEFVYTYGMPVVLIPTNMPLKRTNYPDAIYRTEKEKFEAVVEEIEKWHQEGRPMLVGTISIEKSEKLSRMLEKKKIPHQVLNAKNHEREAAIIAQAGRKGAVTISTNMAGRGTDIILGGNPEYLAREELTSQGHSLEFDLNPDQQNQLQQLVQKYQKIAGEEHTFVVEKGGLHVIGTERHESRRIDNQLRGRAGRQGDPGSSRFFLSMEDDLLRLFGSERISGIMDKFGVEEGVPIEHGLVTRAIEGAQKKVEGYHFNVRKTLLQYDDVMNKQREVIYNQRRTLLTEDNLRPLIFEMLNDVVHECVRTYALEKTYPEEWDWDGFDHRLFDLFGFGHGIPVEQRSQAKPEDLEKIIIARYKEIYEQKVSEVNDKVFREVERFVGLRVVDGYWKEQLHNMDHLREGIGLRAVGQKDPFVEYQIEAFDMFHDMIAQIREDIVKYLLRIRLVPEGGKPAASHRPVQPSTVRTNQAPSSENRKTEVTKKGKIGRNDPCPCGSGKKYKYCCGK